MLDEIDAIGLQRGNTNDVFEISRITINLMQNLDKFKSKSIIIGATNRQDCIDKALIRRFSLKHEIKLPNKETQYKIVESFLNTLPNIHLTSNDIDSFLNTIDNKTCSNIVNTLINKIVNCIVNNKEISLK